MSEKEYITLVFEYETEHQLQEIREIADQNNCRAWSMDHEILRADLARQAVEDKDLTAADNYLSTDGVAQFRNDLRQLKMTHTYTYVVKHEGKAPAVGAGTEINGGTLQAVMFDDGLAKLEKLEDMIAEIRHASDISEVKEIISEYESN